MKYEEAKEFLMSSGYTAAQADIILVPFGADHFAALKHYIDRVKDAVPMGELYGVTTEINSPKLVPLSEYEQAQQRIQELEAALLAIRGLVSMKASTMIQSFARNDVLRIIDKALEKDSD